MNCYDFKEIECTDDGFFNSSSPGVDSILKAKDGKLTLIKFSSGKTLAGITTLSNYVTYYPFQEVKVKKPIKAVLMDLDGTTVDSERFWISVIEQTFCKLSGDYNFRFSEEDFPYISGHSVSEHLAYGIEKYFRKYELANAINVYHYVAQDMLNALITDTGPSRITPSPGLKDFIKKLTDNGIKIGLVTSGIYDKAYPEIYSVCKTLNMDEPQIVYNSIITAGYPLLEHRFGTLGELVAKPHPWLYLETALIGLGISMKDREHIIGFEDSGSGVCALRLAGIPAVGSKNGNIESSGYKCLCEYMYDSLKDVYDLFFE